MRNEPLSTLYMERGLQIERRTRDFRFRSYRFRNAPRAGPFLCLSDQYCGV